MEEVATYKGYLFYRDWFGEEGIRILSPPDNDRMGGVSTRTTVGTVDTVSEAKRFVDELLK